MKTREVVAFAFQHPETKRTNVKQASFYDQVMLSVARKNNLRYFFYGGAVRGGKTYVVLFILVTLARMFPRSRWHIFRASFTELQDTTIPSLEKMIGTEGKDFVWKRTKDNYHVLFSNGSKIFFKSEKATDDPDLNWMLGLETNGIFMEQMEGLSAKLLDRAIERTGSWYIPNMPPPFIFGTFNPTSNWVKKRIYDPFREGELPEDWLFVEALPDDNPFVTADQWKNWSNLDPVSRDQMIRGIWKFLTDEKLFAYSFHAPRTVVDVKTKEGRELMTPKKGLPVWVFFDFNVDPITALIVQADGLKWIKVLAEYRLRNSDLFELCGRIKAEWGQHYLVASGDANARARSANTRGARTSALTIRKLLHLSLTQMKFPSHNPPVKDTRVVLNSLLHSHPACYISSECLWLIDDLENVKVTETGDIDKKKDARRTHLLDNLRYAYWQLMRKWINLQ